MHPSITDYFWNEEQHWLDLYSPTAPLLKNRSELIETIIFNNPSPALACFFARDIGIEAYKMQNLVIALNIPKYATLFAAIVPHADIKTLQKLVIHSNDTTQMVRFAFYVPNANISSLQKAVIKSNNPKAAHDFLKYIPTANINALKDPILKSRKPVYLLELAKRTTSSKLIKQIEDILVKDKAIKHCRLFMGIDGANVRRLERVIMNSGDVKEIKALAKNKASKAAALAVLF